MIPSLHLESNLYMIHWYTLEPELLWCNLLAQASWKRLRYEMLAFHWSSHPSAMAHKAFWRSRPCVQIRDNGRSSLACCLCQSEQVQPALFLIFSITYSWASADMLAPVILTAFIAISFGGDHVPHAVDLCPSSSDLRGFTGNGQSWSIEIETMPFHKNPRQLHLPQVIHRQQLHGHGSLSLFFRVCFFLVSGGIMSPVIIPARWRTQRDRRSCCRSPWNLVSWSHATVRPGYHFVILESSVRKCHDEIMDWLRQRYEKTVQKNKHLHKDIARSAKKLNETAEARSQVSMCSVLAGFNEAIWQEEGFSKVIVIQGRPWRAVPSVNVDSHSGEYFFIQGSCLAANLDSTCVHVTGCCLLDMWVSGHARVLLQMGGSCVSLCQLSGSPPAAKFVFGSHWLV